MVSDRKLAANRKNAAKSGGPRTTAGKRASSQNSYRHGLAIPIGNIKALQGNTRKLALMLSRSNGHTTLVDAAWQAAEAEMEIMRIKARRVEFMNAYDELALGSDLREKLLRYLTSLERYEARAYSRRRRAFRELESSRRR